MPEDSHDEAAPAGAEGAEYRGRVENQIDQFADQERLHGLPAIYRYWNRTYVAPKIQQVYGTRSIYKIYGDAFGGALRRAGGSGRILSIGCGEATNEVAIAKEMRAAGISNFRFLATDLSDIRLERARELVRENDLDEFFEFRVVDINKWDPEERFVGVMAQHALHHIVELERAFDLIDEHMHPEGVFVIVDMIGRNGHMRWPETLRYVEKIWSFLPSKYKFNHQLGAPVPDFINFDCSKKGFEGIRAQDILPLLTEKFAFSHFVGVGGIIDVFAERAFGHNFDAAKASDRNLIDIIARLNDLLLDTGEIKPTIAVAICRNRSYSGTLKTYGDLTPLKAIRRVDARV